MKTNTYNGYINQDRVGRKLAVVVPNKCAIHCKRPDAAANVALMEKLARIFRVYQYDKSIPKYSNEYDLFFWCNDLYFTTGGKETGRDMSYITLTVNDKNSIERRFEVFKQLRAILDEYSDDRISATFDYTSKSIPEAEEAEAKRIFAECDGKKCVYAGMVGRLTLDEGGYVFQKLRVRKYIYRLTASAVCSIVAA